MKPGNHPAHEPVAFGGCASGTAFLSLPPVAMTSDKAGGGESGAR